MTGGRQYPRGQIRPLWLARTIRTERGILAGSSNGSEDEGEDIPAGQTMTENSRKDRSIYSIHKYIEDGGSGSESTLANTEREGKKPLEKHAGVWTSQEMDHKNDEGEEKPGRDQEGDSGSSTPTEGAIGKVREAHSNLCEICAEYGRNDQECFFGSQEEARESHTQSMTEHEDINAKRCNLCRVHKRYELEPKRGCWHERGTKCRFSGEEEEVPSGSKKAPTERKEGQEEEEAMASGSEAKSTPTRSTSPEAEEESQESEVGQAREKTEPGNRERNEARTQERIEECIRMIRETRNYQIFIDNDQEKARRQICAIVLEAEELGSSPRTTRNRQRDGEKAGRYRREARNYDLITLQYVDDEMRDIRKGSEKEVKAEE